MFRFSPAPYTVAVVTAHKTTLAIDVFRHGELVRSESGPAHKIAPRLLGRYGMTQAHLEAAALDHPELVALIDDTLHCVSL